MPPKNAIQNLSGSTTSIDPFIAAATTAPQGFSAEERFEALLELASGYLNEDELALLKRASRSLPKRMVTRNANRANRSSSIRSRSLSS